MDVAAWLQHLGLERYVAAFLDNEVDWEVLPKLTSEDLREIGVAAIGHQGASCWMPLLRSRWRCLPPPCHRLPPLP